MTAPPSLHGPDVSDVLAADPGAPAGRRRILVAYGADPSTTANYLVSALRRRHDVVTWGPTITAERLAALDMPLPEGRAFATDLGFSGARPAAALARQVPGWKPELALWIESEVACPVQGLDRLGCPTASYLIDTHLDVCKHLALARRFDLVFLAHRAYVERFRAGGHAAHWLPVACDLEVHGERPVARVHPIGFVGTQSDPRRVALLGRLAARFFVASRRCFREEMAELYSRSRLVFNSAINQDLNMRVFEAMAAGALLLTDPAPGSGLEDFFSDGVHCAIYRSDEEVVEVARSWLADRERAARVARRGQEEVRARHTYAHRIALLERIAFPGGTTAG